MSDLRKEPSMEDILASIKRIIAEDNATVIAGARARPLPTLRAVQAEPAEEDAAADPAPPVAVGEEEVLELDNPVPGPPAGSSVRPELVSDDATLASRQSLAALSAMVVRSDPDSQSNTLEGLVRELLRPMLKDWLDARLPELVEGLVAREIARITGKSL